MAVESANATKVNGMPKLYSVNVQAKAHSSTSCSFCWFVLSLYPSTAAMTARDALTFRVHLEKAHGLQGEIPQ
jgi:hypothetical protein